MADEATRESPRASGEPPEIIETALRTARELLGMEAAYVTRFADGRQRFESVEGDAESFGFVTGGSLPLEDSYCVRMTDGRLANVVADARANEELRGLPVTEEAQIGAYVGVPLQASDGALFGSLCCISHTANPELAKRDIRFMHVLGRLVADHLRLQAVERAARERAETALIERTAALRQATAAVEISEAETVLRLARAVEYRDEDTGKHINRIARSSSELALRAGLDPAFCELLRHASPLHDAGKVAIPDAVLLKPGKLTPDERRVIETHAQVGYELLRGSTSEVLHLAASVAWTHHEHFDGRGYPRGLAGGEIPVEGRIVALADVFDALTSDRVYRSAMSADEALALILRDRGSHFDPDLVDAFVPIAAELAATARERSGR